MARDQTRKSSIRWRTSALLRRTERVKPYFYSELELHAMRMGPGKHLQGRTLMGGIVKPEEFDYFHEVRNRPSIDSPSSFFFQLVLTQELVRCGARGYGDGGYSANLQLWLRSHSLQGLLGGKVIGLPPVLNFGSEELKARIVPDVLAAKKFICLAISEGCPVLLDCCFLLIVVTLSAHAGSDVMGLQTTAVKSEDGKEWIINGASFLPSLAEHHLKNHISGSKKWITNGTLVSYTVRLQGLICTLLALLTTLPLDARLKCVLLFGEILYPSHLPFRMDLLSSL